MYSLYIFEVVTCIFFKYIFRYLISGVNYTKIHGYHYTLIEILREVKLKNLLKIDFQMQ